MKKEIPLRSLISFSLAIATLIAVAATDPSIAEAQTAKEKARASALLKEGAALLGDKEYAEALEKFEAAYAVVPSPKILFNVGLTNEGLARPVRALRAFSDYLAGATSDTAQRRKEASDHIGVLKTKVALVLIQADVDGAHVSIDGEESGITPLSDAVAVEPGNHQIVVQSATGKPWTKAIKALAGSTLRLEATVKEAPVPVVNAPAVGSSTVPTIAHSPGNANNNLTASATQSEVDSPFYTKGWFWGVTGAVVVAGVVTAILLSNGGTTTEYECPAGIPCINR